MRITTIPAGDSSRVAYRGLSAWADRRRTRRQPPTWNAANSSRSRWKSGQMTRCAARGAPSSRAACCMTGRSWRKQRIAVQACGQRFRGATFHLAGYRKVYPRMEQAPKGHLPPRNTHGAQEPMSSSTSGAHPCDKNLEYISGGSGAAWRGKQAAGRGGMPNGGEK